MANLWQVFSEPLNGCANGLLGSVRAAELFDDVEGGSSVLLLEEVGHGARIQLGGIEFAGEERGGESWFQGGRSHFAGGRFRVRSAGLKSALWIGETGGLGEESTALDRVGIDFAGDCGAPGGTAFGVLGGDAAAARFELFGLGRASGVLGTFVQSGRTGIERGRFGKVSGESGGRGPGHAFFGFCFAHGRG